MTMQAAQEPNASCIVCLAPLYRRQNVIAKVKFFCCQVHHGAAQRLYASQVQASIPRIILDPSVKVPVPTCMVLLAEVAAIHNVTVEQLRSPGRKGGTPMFDARSAAAKRLRTERKWSLNQIGRLLGGRHHTVILRMVDDQYRQKTIAKVRAKFHKGWRHMQSVEGVAR